MEYAKSNRVPINGSDTMGAIFLCSKLTKDECFKRNLFGLHSKHSDFVKLVKTGMILFLFEPEEQKLNGIFKATSDGAMNIVPSAFSISKKCFPAQVRFERLYTCSPLSENEFSEAIKENYFTPTKFTFALSSQQVCRLIWLFSSKSGFPYDQFLEGAPSEFMKSYEKFNLARTRATGHQKLLKYDPAGYNMHNNNVRSIRNTVLTGRSKNHLPCYLNHDLHDITLQNHIIRGQYEPYPDAFYTVESGQPDQMFSTPCYDSFRESSSYCSSSRLQHKQPSFYLGTDYPYLGEKKFNFCTDSFLDAEASHMRNQSFTSAPHLGTKYFTLTKYFGVDLSEISPKSKPSQPTLHSPEDHTNFHGFNQSDFPEGFLPPSGRLHTMPSPSHLRNPRAYSPQTLQEDGSLNLQARPSALLPDYIPILKDETLVNSSCNPMLKDEMVSEAFEMIPHRNKYEYRSGFKNKTNFKVEDNFDSICNYKSSAPDSKKFSQSNTFQKKCSVFGRLTPSSKEFNDPSLEQVLESLHQRRNLRTKVKRKFENLGNLKAYVQQLDNIVETGLFENESLTEKKPKIEEFAEDNGFQFPNFKRRSTVKQQSTGASDLVKCKKRKIIRPTFTEEEDSSQVKNNSQNHISRYGEGSESVGNLRLPLSNLQDERDASSTNSLTIFIQGSQQTLDCQSELCEKFPIDPIIHESEKINSCIIMRENNVDGKLEENSHDLPLDSLALPVEGQHNVTDNSTDVIFTSNASVSDGLAEKDSASSILSNASVAKMDAQGFLLCNIRYRTETPDLAGACNNITSDPFIESNSNYEDRTSFASALYTDLQAKMEVKVAGIPDEAKGKSFKPEVFR